MKGENETEQGTEIEQSVHPAHPILSYRTKCLRNDAFFKWLEEFKFAKDKMSDVGAIYMKEFCSKSIQEMEERDRHDYAWVIRLSHTDEGIMRRSGTIIAMEDQLERAEFPNKAYIAMLFYAVSISACITKGDVNSMKMAENFVIKGVRQSYTLQSTLDHTNRFWRYCGMYYDKMAVLALSSWLRKVEHALRYRCMARECFRVAREHALASDEVRKFADRNVVQRALQFHCFINLMHKIAYNALIQCPNENYIESYITLQDLQEAEALKRWLFNQPVVLTTERTKFLLHKCTLIFVYRKLELLLNLQMQHSSCVTAVCFTDTQKIRQARRK